MCLDGCGSKTDLGGYQKKFLALQAMKFFFQSCCCFFFGYSYPKNIYLDNKNI